MGDFPDHLLEGFRITDEGYGLSLFQSTIAAG